MSEQVAEKLETRMTLLGWCMAGQHRGKCRQSVTLRSGRVSVCNCACHKRS
jgi:hypothetical protein